MDSYASYQQLKQPRWAPPAWVFGPVWTFLYILIAISFGTVFWMAAQGEILLVITAPFVLNLVFNFSYTWLQFGLRNNYLASADVVLVVVTLLWAMSAIYPIAPWIALINIPYLLWVSFATVLQLTITYLNR